MRLLVTGGAGFIGSNYVSHCQKLGVKFSSCLEIITSLVKQGISA